MLKVKPALHPNIYRLINAFKVQDAITHLTLAKADAGEGPPKRKHKICRACIELLQIKIPVHLNSMKAGGMGAFLAAMGDST